MIFDPILLFGLDMGVEGIALATVLGQILSRPPGGALPGPAVADGPPQPGGFPPRRLGGEEYPGPGRPHLLQPCADDGFPDPPDEHACSTYGAQSVYGSEVTIAGAGSMGKVVIVLFSCIIGIALGCQPILGFNYGRKNYGRVVEAYQKAPVLWHCGGGGHLPGAPALPQQVAGALRV